MKQEIKLEEPDQDKKTKKAEKETESGQVKQEAKSEKSEQESKTDQVKKETDKPEAGKE